MNFEQLNLIDPILDAIDDQPVPWAGVEFIDKAILVGTPNAGSVRSMIALDDILRSAFQSMLADNDGTLLPGFQILGHA